jgi:hypothetical protein
MWVVDGVEGGAMEDQWNFEERGGGETWYVTSGVSVGNDVFPKISGYERLGLGCSGWVIQPHTGHPGECKVACILNVDWGPKMSQLPQWLLEKVMFRQARAVKVRQVTAFMESRSSKSVISILC